MNDLRDGDTKLCYAKHHVPKGRYPQFLLAKPAGNSYIEVVQTAFPIWIVFTVAASLSLAGYNAMMRLSGGSNPLAFLAIANACSCLIYLLCIYFARTDAPNVSGMFDMRLLWLGLFTGLCIAGLEIFFLKALQVSQGMSLVYSALAVLSLVFTILIGLIFFKEKIFWQHYVGILFAIIAVALLSYQKSP